MFRIFQMIIVFVVMFPILSSAEDVSSLANRALENNTQVMSAKADWKVFQKKIPQSSALSDPMVKYYFMGEIYADCKRTTHATPDTRLTPIASTDANRLARMRPAGDWGDHALRTCTEVGLSMPIPRVSSVSRGPS